MVDWHPRYCRTRAFEYFCHNVPKLRTMDGLFHAALGVALHPFGEAEPSAAERHIDDLVQKIQSRIQNGQSCSALVAHMHDVLFEQEGFSGNEDDYYNPVNSLLPVVLATRRGIPVTLSLIYATVASRLGLHVHGLNTPGHFLVQVNLEDDSFIVDPYFGGQMLNAGQVRERLYKMSRVQYSPSEPFPIATNRQWIVRILANLTQLYKGMDQIKNQNAMEELLAVVQHS